MRRPPRPASSPATRWSAPMVSAGPPGTRRPLTSAPTWARRSPSRTGRPVREGDRLAHVGAEVSGRLVPGGPALTIGADQRVAGDEAGLGGRRILHDLVQREARRR